MMSKDTRKLPNLRVIQQDEFMANHNRLAAMSTPDLERRIAELRNQEDDIRQRWSKWHKTILDKCSPLQEKYDRMRRSRQSNAAEARTAAAFKKSLKWRWERLPLFEK